jgi:precorrin-6Y C5,15-methyltransferase (decarboxylating)
MTPWLTFIGIGEDGLPGLSAAARSALDAAAQVFGAPRHLDLAQAGARGKPWPIPFDPTPVLAWRGSPTVVLASGDPFWHGAGGTLAPRLSPPEWISHPAPSTFQIAANRLGWRLEDTAALGLHAAPFSRLINHLHPDARIVATLRDAAAVAALAQWLAAQGHPDAILHVLERLGGPQERLRRFRAADPAPDGIAAPVAVAISGVGTGLPATPGLPDDAFASDGQITKSPIRAITLAALAPRPGDHLWDIGAGSGSVSVEFCRAGGTATAIEARDDRAANIRTNALRFGVDHRLHVVAGKAPDALAGLPPPHAVFVGGGGSQALFDHLRATLPPGTRLVANAVTLETETLLATLHARHGGTLTRIDIATATPLSAFRGWTAARPVVQWATSL